MKKVQTIIKLLMLIVCLSLLSSCKNDYNKGYDAGYSAGKVDGYREGKKDGYSSGYKSGTMSYVKEHGLPSLGLSIIILFFFAATYYLYQYFKDPARRIIVHSTESIEANRQKIITKKELERKKLSIDEQARIKARNIANKVFEKTITAISDEKSLVEVEKMKQEAEEKIFRIQLEEIDKIVNEYRKSIESLNASSSLSAKEKSELYSNIREILSEG